jgi:energy-coupling factor transporter ATP-binding protein EcfA2
MRLLPKGGSWGFFGWHTIPIQAKQIIITEGELDAMSVAQTTGLPVISLPNGANSLPPALLPSLERFEKIVLWLDDDQAGHAAVESMTQKLGVGRTYHIPGGYGAKDANEALQKGLNIGAILDTATRQQHKQLSTFPSFRHEVKRMFFDPNTQVGVQFPNMPILQSLIKGHRRGELTILTGGTGVGKTTLLTQMSLELASQGVNTLWGSFEIRNPRLVKTLMKQYAAVLGVVLNEQHPEAFDYIADKFEDLPFNFLKFYGSSPVQEVIEAMEYATYVHDVQHIILDNLQFMLSGQGRGGGDKFELQDRAIEAFRQFASQRNVHVTLVIHPRKEQDNSSLGLASVFGSAKATQEADNVMIIQGGLPRTVLRNIQLPDSEGKKASTQLRQSGGVGDLAQHGGFDDPIIGEIMGTFFRTIEIRKNRWDGDLGAVPLRFDKSSSRFYELTSDDISLGLGEFIAKQKKLKQLDLIKHMNQLPGSAGLSQPTRSGFDNMSQNHQSQPQTPGDKWKAKAQAQRALAEHFSSGNLNNEAQQEIRQQYSDQKLQSAMNNGLGLSSQQEEELQRQFDQMYGLSKPLGQTSDGDGDDDDESNTPQRPSGISYGSPEAMAIRNMETKMLNDMEKSFADSSVSSGNFQNHPQFQQLQQKQQQFKSNAGGKKDDASKFKKHAAPVGYTPTLDIVFE